MNYLNAIGATLTDSGAGTNVTVTPSSAQTRLGTDRNDIFYSGFAADILKGGKGDDSYYLWSANTTVVEKPGEGTDTIYVEYWGAAVLPDNVENLVLVSKGATSGTGNALDNVIVAGSSGATLNGKAGNDVLVGGAGADVFVVEKGNGSDAIVNFEPGKDAILLKNYGFTSFGQIQAAATQTGADTSINLGNGETLVLRGTALSSLHAADFGMMTANQQLTTSAASLLNSYNTALHAFDPTPITLASAGSGWNANGWYVLNNMWGTGTMKEGVDFVVNSTFSRANMTSGVTFNWSLPYSTDPGITIKGYPEVAFGVPPKGNYAADPTDTAAVFPVKVADLKQLTATYDVSWGGTASGYNVSYDIWLTSKPNGDASTITNEVMVWVHQGSFTPPGTVIGTFTQNGVTGTIYHTGTYTAVVLDHDVPAGTLDVTALLAKLESLGVVSANEYLAAVELGAEVVSGVGTLTINKLNLTVTSQNADGSLVTKNVTGAGTTVTQTSLLAQHYTAGSEHYVDAHGIVAGTKVTSFDATGKVTVQYFNTAMKVIGTDVVTSDAAGAMTTQHLNGAGKLTGADVVKTATDGSTSTEHYDASWKLTGSDAVRLATDGSTATYHYDGSGKLLSVDAVKVAADGTTTYHYDGSWNYLGMDAAKTNADGSVSNYHYDTAGKLLTVDVVQTAAGKTTAYHYTGSWSLTGIDTTTVDAKGNVSIQHYDKNWKLLGADAVASNADGSVTTTHFNGTWGVIGYDTDKLDANGVTTSTHYNSKYQVTSIDLTGSGAADTLTGTGSTTNLHGGRGSDTLVSGSGATNFWFDTAIGGGDVDQVSKFAVAKDGIYLSQSIFSGIKSLGDLSASAFATGTAATSADTRIIFDKATGNLFYDADGNGSGAAVLFAHVDADKALTAANFHVVA